ncbi:MAG: isoprenylcysteine carboxylmethyltransferase family protein [Pseudomonadota bacterium]|nr:MAG: isoprenylcysteine carboxylmethyltransferase family protein [Pseudomonadota bacterium]
MRLDGAIFLLSILPSQFASMMTKQSPARIWVSLALRMCLFAIALMWPAGTWRWWEAWVLVGLWAVFGVVMTNYLLRHDPALLAERLKLVPLHKDQKHWDKVLMLAFLVAGIGLYIVPGFDVVRFGWSEALPLWMQVVAMFIHLPCFVMLGWVMRENTYLSQVVRIDEERDHRVITTGPYALVRHPMYTVTIVLLFAVPVALGSRFALVLAVFLTGLLIVRTCFEDRTLHAELPGYPEYVKQTRYRLLPGVW